MDISKILTILLGSILIYLIFLFLGFNLRNKNIKAQNLTKKRNNYFPLEIFHYFFLIIFYRNKKDY